MTTNIPAIDCPLTGAYLIEASAGTGKTWTLSGIILRLLIEQNIPPQKILATTFTRAAAKEIYERIFKRLTDFYDACLWLELHKEHLYHQEISAQKDYYCQYKEKTQDKSGEEYPFLADAVNEHLIFLLLSKPLEELVITLKKIKVLLLSLDKMFVGTLDSLAQKLLKEFASETQNLVNLELITNSDTITLSLVHDELRALHNHFYYNQPELYRFINHKAFNSPKDIYNKIKKSLTFFSAPILDVQLPDVNELLENINSIKTIELKDFEPYYSSDYCKAQGMSANSVLTKNLALLPNIVKKIQEFGGDAFKKFDDNEKKLIEKFNEDGLDVFKKGYDKQKEQWLSLAMPILPKIYSIYQKITALDNDFEAYLLITVANSVREKLQHTLLKENKTTFTLQTLALIKMLQGENGKKIAEHIRHLYPVALVDEAQDINNEQAEFIRLVYLSDTAKKALFNQQKGFLLLVGDPKQAIYRFRGGDVANYNFVKGMGLNSDFKLTTNRRSNIQLIESLNHWFMGSNGNFGQGIDYQTITADKSLPILDNHKNDVFGEKALALLHLDALENAFKFVATHINELLQSNVHIIEQNDAGVIESRTVEPSDIAVLVAKNEDALEIQSYLNEFFIKSSVSYQDNIFTSQACQDLYVLFDVLFEQKEEKLSALLTGLFGYSLEYSKELLASEEQRSVLLSYLKTIKKLWYQKSLYHALQFAFNEHPFENHSVWEFLAGFENSERYLTDLWQLFEYLSQKTIAPLRFLAYLTEQMSVASDEFERINLPSSSAVSVMTLHKSKGLEFNIVYILGMDKTVIDKGGFYPFIEDSENTPTRMLSAQKIVGETDYSEMNKKEELDEKKRLAYVALTRAKAKAFVVAKDFKKSNNNIMKGWGFLNGATYQLPEQLKDWVSFLDISQETLTKTVYQPQTSTRFDGIFFNWQEVYLKNEFFGVYRTSFTNLSHKIIDKQAAQIPLKDELSQSVNPDIKDYGEPTLADDIINDSQDIRQSFARGAVAGTFLHKVLEDYLTYHNPVEQILVLADTYYLTVDENIASQLAKWADCIVHKKFKASNISLAKLSVNQKQAELEFMLGIDGLNLDQLQEIFEQYSERTIGEFAWDNRYYAYFSGIIDLVYEYQGKYYVVDFKSNYLENYAESSMAEAMDKHHYWLQATFYQLALHRLLKNKLPEYIGNESQYLGAVEYVFLRGIEDDTDAGQLTWQVPLELILKLDDLLGK